MSAFFVNYQIKSDDLSAVVGAVSAFVQGRAYVSPPSNGWVTLYDEISEQQDAYQIGQLGGELSAHLQTVVFVFLVNDSSLFVYYLFDNGDLLDEYHSAPTPSNEAAEMDQRTRFTGRPEILLNYCAPGISRGDLKVALLRGDSLVEGGFASLMYAEERLHPLASALQMDDQRTTMGYNDFDRLRASIPQGNEFQQIDGKRLRRQAPRRIPPPIPPQPR